MNGVTHSLMPKYIDEIETRVKFGGSDCKQPYMASHLNISAMSLEHYLQMLLWL